MADRYNNSRRSRSSGPTQYLLDLHAKLIPPTLHVSNKDRHASAMQTDQNTLKRLSADPSSLRAPLPSLTHSSRSSESRQSLSTRYRLRHGGPCDTPARASEADDVSDLDGEMMTPLGDLRTLPSSRSRRHSAADRPRTSSGVRTKLSTRRHAWTLNPPCLLLPLLWRSPGLSASSFVRLAKRALCFFGLLIGTWLTRSDGDPAKWLPADADTVRGIQPTDSALDFRWRPEVMANGFSGQAADQYERYYRAGKSLKHTQWS